MMNEQEYLQRLADEAHDTVDLLSSRMKGERERRVCAAFLRCLGVDFSPEALTIPESDLPDVVFGEARFEVMIVLDEGRKKHAEWKEIARWRGVAKNLGELTEPYKPSVAMAFAEVVDRISAELAEKACHYGVATCSGLDALVYINFRGRHLYPLSDVEIPEGLRSQGWRSICFFIPSV